MYVLRCTKLNRKAVTKTGEHIPFTESGSMVEDPQQACSKPYHFRAEDLKAQSK